MPGYYARISKQRGGGYLVEFPDLPGCLTEGGTIEDALANAKEALSGWLFVVIKHAEEVPAARLHRGRGFHLVTPDIDVAVPLMILSARKQRGLTQQQVARSLGISQQAYQKYELPGRSNPTIKTLSRLSNVIGAQLTLLFG